MHTGVFITSPFQCREGETTLLCTFSFGIIVFGKHSIDTGKQYLTCSPGFTRNISLWKCNKVVDLLQLSLYFTVHYHYVNVVRFPLTSDPKTDKKKKKNRCLQLWPIGKPSSITLQYNNSDHHHCVPQSTSQILPWVNFQ